MPELEKARRERLRPALAALGADAALITSPANVRYLTGLASSNAALLLPAAPAGAVLATDSRYAGTARQACPDLDILIERAIEPALARVAATRGLRRLAFEAHEMTVERYRAFAAQVPGTELVPLGRAVEEIRMAKDEQEIALLARACEITSRAFEQIVPLIRPGVTERELAISLERAMTDLGADGLAFDTIVASGPNGAIPHHVPSGRAFEAGDMITVDCGARYQGYHADMTRTVVLGPPAPWQRDIYSLVVRGPGGRDRRGRARRGRARRGRGGPRPDRGGGSRRAFPARARPRRRARSPRGTDHGVRPDGYTRGPGPHHCRTRDLPPRARRRQDRGHPGGARRYGDGGTAGATHHYHPGTARPVRRPSAAGRAPARRRHADVATTNDLKNGMTLNIDGQLWNIVDFQHVKPGKGGAFVRTRLKNIMSGKVVDRTFNAGVKVDVANVDKREMQYLYREGDDFVFMDTQDYDQPRIPRQTVGGAADYLLEEQTATVAFNDGTPLYVELPASVELTVSQTDPGVQGDRSTGGTKPATLETGAQINVPLFITTGEKVKVDTRTGDYMGRA